MRLNKQAAAKVATTEEQQELPPTAEPMTEEEAAQPAVSAADKPGKRELLEAALNAERELDVALQAVAAHRAELGARVEHLVNVHGTGPWKLNGEIVRARVRKGQGQLVRGESRVEEI